MRIAYFTDTYYPEVNGIVTSILKSSERLALRGHKIMIFCPKYAKDNKVPKLHKNIKVVRSFSLPLITYEDVRISWPNHASILRKVRRFKPDVIHMHTPGPVSGAAIICSTLLRKPLVGTFHTLVTEQLDYASFRNLPPVARMKAMLRYMKNLTGILDRMPGRTGGKSRHSYTRRLKWLAGKIGEMKIRNRKVSSVIKRQIKKPGKISLMLKQRLVWQLLRIAYRRCHLITAPSPRIVSELKKRRFGSRIRYVSNGIDFSVFKRKTRYQNNKRIVSVGRVSFEKNIDVAVKSMKFVVKKHPSATLTIVGDGPALPSLKSLVEDLGLDKNVIFKGVVPYKKLTAWYNRSDVFVTASTMETQGLTILEAMYCGLPTVGVRKYAIPDWVKNDVNGYVVPPFNPRSMADAISQLLDSNKKLEKLGRAAYATAKEHDLKKVILQVEDLYLSLVKLALIRTS